jgi:hypothetical protein
MRTFEDVFLFQDFLVIYEKEYSICILRQETSSFLEVNLLLLLLFCFNFFTMATYILFFLLCDCVLQVNLPTCDIPPPSTSLSVPAQCSGTHYPGAWLLLTHPSSGMTLGAPHSLACSKADVQCYRMCA